ncbi:MAG: Kae1-associated serine/threonine protein kinase [Candidatus Aenigmarchaeota archaeon]|nr:Kae1-associated serine/threonine protein kinase [Candidatus Aenigmarchaeota archaeon]
MKIVNRGAEAILYLKEKDGRKVLIKERVQKNYRVKQLDNKLRKDRTGWEVGLLDKAKRNGLHVPQVLDSTDYKIEMEFLDGEKLKDFLSKKPEKEGGEIARQIGSTVAQLHSAGIVHGDLTTSNMILQDKKIYLIDFGLGKNSTKVEDQATDLYLLYEAIKSTHFDFLNIMWKGILDGYKEYQKHKDVIKRFEEIGKRRRYKTDS